MDRTHPAPLTSDEDEVFFGPITEKEKLKARKFSRRKTAYFVPGFRDDRQQMRMTMDPGKLTVLDELEDAADQKENFPPRHVVSGESAGKPRLHRTPLVRKSAAVIDYANGALAEEPSLIDISRTGARYAHDVKVMNDSTVSLPAAVDNNNREQDERTSCLAITEYRSPRDIILRGFSKATMASDVAIRQVDFSAEQIDYTVIDSSFKEDVTMATKRVSSEGHDESVNSSMSSNGAKPEMMAEACVVPTTDVETPKAAKAVYDMSPLVQTLPALKVTTPMRLHDEHNSAFKMYGSQGDLRVGKDMLHDNPGGDSGIEDGGSESPSKASRASSCATTISPDVVDSPLVKAVVKKKCETPKSKRKMDRTPRQRSEDRTNSYIHSDERKPRSSATSTPLSPRVTRSSRSTLRSHAKIDPREVTERLHSPAPLRCCRHNHVKLNADGRPDWNSSTLLDNQTSCRGKFLNSKDPPYSSPFSFLSHTPGSTPRPSRKKTPNKDTKDPVPKFDLDQLDSVPRKVKGHQNMTPATGDDLKNPSEKRARSPASTHSNPPNKRLPFRSSDVDNSPSPKDHQLLSLNEHQLDAVTNLHTMCNGQQQAKFVTKPLATTMIKKAPEPKSPRIQWPSNPAIELDSPSPVAINKTAKPILHIRKPDEFFPYVGEPPSPVVVKKTLTRRSANPLSTFTF